MIRLMLMLYAILSVFAFDHTKPAVHPPAQKEEKLIDIKYGPFERNMMDVYLPANRTAKTPFVLMIHGGAWVAYNKENMRAFQDSLLKHGIASASINHRYADKNSVHYQQMLADVDKAYTYCSAHAAGWKTDFTHVAMAGASSGAHLAMLYAYTTDKKIKAVVDLSGPANLNDTATLNYVKTINLIDAVEKMTGDNYTQGKVPPPSYKASSPVTHVKNIPTLIVHGDADRVVPYNQSQQLDKALEAKGVTHKLVTLNGVDHGIAPTDTLNNRKMYREVISWIEKYDR